LRVDAFTGNIYIWLNSGQMETGGRSFYWAKQGNIRQEGVG